MIKGRQEGPKAGEEAPTAAGPVLVVEDDYEIRRMIRWLLEDEGLTVETAGDGEEALHQVMDHRPALVVLDLNLPIVDGEEVAAAVRAAYGDSVPIVVVSSDTNRSARARRVGAVEALRKPFEIEDLVEAVWEGLRSQ
jgi:DNA-binding response OmpR family regulator